MSNTLTSRSRSSRFILVSLCALLTLFVVSSTSVSAQDTTRPDTLLTISEWKAFEANIKSGIRSNNQGVMESSLGQIARFGDYMDFTHDDVITVVRIYRENGVFRNRHMAITAVGQMNDRWGVDFLDMLSTTETSESLQSSMRNVVDSYWEKNGGNPYQD